MPFLSTTYSWVGALFFAFSFFFHLLLWKARLRGFPTLFFVFLFPPLALLLLSLFHSDFFIPGLIHFILSANYLAIYPAFQASSPSIKMLTILFTKAEMKPGDLLSCFPKNSLLSDRYHDLKEAGLISQKGDTWELHRGAKIIARVFLVYRKLLGLEAGKG